MGHKLCCYARTWQVLSLLCPSGCILQPCSPSNPAAPLREYMRERPNPGLARYVAFNLKLRQLVRDCLGCPGSLYNDQVRHLLAATVALICKIC